MVIVEARPDTTLILDGPASAKMVSGKAEVLGAPLTAGQTLIVRRGKRLPVYAEEKAIFESILSEKGFAEVNGNTVPCSWQNASANVINREKPIVVMIIGEVDSGKSSLCTFLANRALTAKLKVAIIDADLGQSDIGPPTTLSLVSVGSCFTDLFRVEADESYFVGKTSPQGIGEQVARIVADFRRRALGEGQDFLLVNTDGWIEGQEAARYKIALAYAVEPTVVIGIQREQELAPILGGLKAGLALPVSCPTVVRRRTRDERKTLRELAYRKYLRDARVAVFSLSIVEMGETKFLMGLPFAPGLVAGLRDEQNQFLGLGIIEKADFQGRIVKVRTRVHPPDVASIQVGDVILDDQLRELKSIFDAGDSENS